MMTFSTDSSMGLSNDPFSGSAIVFLSTITYPRRGYRLEHAGRQRLIVLCE
jgi:hypothetical protein